MACRLTADAQLFSRTATVPSEISATLMCWAMQYVSTATFSTVISLDTGGDAFTVEFGSDGVTLGIHTVGASDTAFGAIQPVIRQPFCCAITVNGAAVTGYVRRWGDKRWDTVADTAIGTFTAAGLSVGNFRPTPTGNGLRGSVWNFKAWDRPLTDQQLMVESLYDDVVDTRDCHLFWRLKHPGDLVDYGPRGQRRPTRVSTPTPSGDHFKVPLLRRSRNARRPFVAPAAGGFFSRVYYDMIGANRV